MAQLREEIYDENGLVEVRFIDVEDQPIEEVIADKEAQLLALYQELQLLKK